ncbi:MAG: nucleotide exchange factor GrpE [Neomegalonema sp.]|nr:nucleotide exchange factor GrpE [Neomegalonema sp.]
MSNEEFEPITKGAAKGGDDAAADTAAGPELTDLGEAASSSDARDAEINELKSQLAAAQDKLMRAAADVQNIRKRADRERREAEVFGGTKLARDLLTVYDNLENALSHASDEFKEKEAGLFGGVDLTKKELLNAFSKHKILPIDPEIGTKFDANFHQAMYEAPSATAPAGAVIEVIQVGFKINDRLLRPAMVGVARQEPDNAPEVGSALD